MIDTASPQRLVHLLVFAVGALVAAMVLLSLQGCAGAPTGPTSPDERLEPDALWISRRDGGLALTASGSYHVGRRVFRATESCVAAAADVDALAAALDGPGRRCLETSDRPADPLPWGTP